jgi:integrase/recombinase XerD
LEEGVRENKRIPKRGKHGWFISTPPSYLPLLNFQCVKDWIELYSSRKTRKNYLGYLNMIVNFTKLNPEELLRLDGGEAKRLILRCARWKVQEGRPEQGRLILAVAKSFFSAHDRELRFKRGERIRAPKKKIIHEIIPNKYEVYRMADHAGSLRDKAIILCLWQSGVRASCICRWTYGLVRGYLYPEVKAPVYLKITNQMDTKLSGYGLPYYYTFLQREAAEALREYLDWRMVKGWKPSEDDLIFVTQRGMSKNRPLDYWNIRLIVKEAARKAGFNPKNIWAHCLRKAFRKILYTSGLDPDFAETLMGHKLPASRGNYFDFHDIDELANQYMKCSFAQDLPSRMNRLDERIRQLETENLSLKEQLRTRNAQTEGLATRIEKLEDTLGEVFKWLALFAGPGAKKLAKKRGLEHVFKKVERELKGA